MVQDGIGCNILWLGKKEEKVQEKVKITLDKGANNLV